MLELRRTYHLGPQRIVWYMDRYHDTRISFSSIYRVLVRNGVRRLPKQVRRRVLHTPRYGTCANTGVYTASATLEARSLASTCCAARNCDSWVKRSKRSAWRPLRFNSAASPW